MRNPFKGLFKRGIDDPQYWLTRLASSIGAVSSANQNVNSDTALKVSAVYSCIKLRSETIASLPLMLYERTGDGKKPAVEHPAYSLLHDKPNVYMTAFDFRQCQMAHLDLRGNFYALKQENGRGIMALIPLSPARMNVMREGNLVKYEYTHEDGKQEVFSAERIWHVKNMPISSSYNGEAPEGLVGISPIAASHEAVGLAMAADQYGGRYFANNAQVGLAFNYPGKLGENAKTFLKESLEKYAQMENKFRSIIVEEGGKIENLGITNEDSQFLQSRQFQIEEICRIFGVYPILVGHPTNTMTYASAEQLFLAFGKFTILPICKRIEQSANMNLLSEKDRQKYFFEHVMDGLLRADTATRYTVYSQARQWGIMNVDEIRALENMNPLPEEKGQIYLQPMNMIEAGEEPPEKKPFPAEPKEEIDKNAKRVVKFNRDPATGKILGAEITDSAVHQVKLSALK